MKTILGRLMMLAIMLTFLFGSLTAQNLYEPEKRYWEPMPDDVYLQEVSEKITTDMPVTAIAEYKGQCYAVAGGSLYQLKEGNLNKMKSSPSNFKRLIKIDGNVWALASDGIYRLNKSKWQKIDNREYVDLCMHAGALHGATKEEIYRLENDKFISIKPENGYYSSNMTFLMEDGTQLHADPVRLGPIERIASYTGTLYILRPGKLALFDGLVVNTDFVDWGVFPSKNTRDMLSFGSRLFVSTDKGLSVLRGAALTTLKGKDGLPYEDTKCLVEGFDNDMWIGTSKGAIRMLKDDWHYFGADHWLPGNNVNAIAVGDRDVYIATDAGIGIVHYEPYTLQKKAEFYERHIDEWGQKRLGFIQTLSKTENGEWIREVSDNDGGHTTSYLAGLCFKYAVTKDEKTRQKALDSFYAMLWLERITPIEGYVARAIWAVGHDKGEMAKHGSGGLPAKWYPTSDGKWIWKGDTSSDEIIGHFYCITLFHDLVAQGEEKELAKEHIRRIASYIQDNGFVLKGMDGKPTRWGRWNPEYLLRPYGYVDRGINGLEALTFMRAAYGLTGDEKFEDGYQQLLKWGYHTNTIRQKNVFPPENVAPWDDNLAFRSYYTLLRNTKDPALRSVYLRSLARTWEVKRIEQVPWFNYSYGAITGYDCEQEKSIKHLREMPLDCIEHNFTNSFRDDLYTPHGYVTYEGGIRAISPREQCMMRNSRYALTLDGGQNSMRVLEPNAFIRDYWMGRYHGLIEAPTVTDPELLDVKPSKGKFGAAPYDGPPRPEIK